MSKLQSTLAAGTRALAASSAVGAPFLVLGSQGGALMTRTNAQLDCYCERIEKHLPVWSSRFLRWLRLPSSRNARILVSTLLVLGSLFSFLPVLGVWMLPLGLIIISQDLPFLQAPLVRAFEWLEASWERLQRWRKQR